MKRYLLLRNNQESGPFSFDELRNLKLHALDLIWVEEESTHWMYPEELPELKELVVKEEKQYPLRSQSSRQAAHVFISMPRRLSETVQAQRQEQHPATDDCATPEKVTRKWEALKEAYPEDSTKKEIWGKRFVKSGHPLLVLTLIFAGLLGGAALLKNMIDQFGETPDDTMPAAVAVMAPPKPNLQPAPSTASTDKLAMATAPAPRQPVLLQAKSMKPRPEKHADLSKFVQVRSNDYKVGLFGGINNLQLTVFNNSDEPIEKVVVVVDYLKPNGTVVNSSTHELRHINPFRSQTLQVPPSKRGVKINYRIKYVEGQKQKAALKNI